MSKDDGGSDLALFAGLGVLVGLAFLLLVLDVLDDEPTDLLHSALMHHFSATRVVQVSDRWRADIWLITTPNGQFVVKVRDFNPAWPPEVEMWVAGGPER